MRADAGFPSAAARYARLGWSVIPFCVGTARGVCGCGRGHDERAGGKAPLVAWERFAAVPPSPAHLARWSRFYSSGNVGVLLGPSRLLVIDCDSAPALEEARALGLPPAPGGAA